MRLFLLLLILLACEPTVSDEETVELTLRVKLAGGRNLGSTPGRVWAFMDSAPVARAFAFPEAGEACVLDRTPETTCTFQVPRFRYVSLIATEPDPAVVVRFAPKSPDDTVRDGRFVEFTGWTDCPDRPERGVCVIRLRNSTTIEANFQPMQQVTVYQTGAARMHYRMYAAGPTLKVPASNGNILDEAGCRRSVADSWVMFNVPCDSIRMVGDVPYHRFTAYVSRKTTVGMFPGAGLETEFQSWAGDCILSGIYWPGVCSFISPDTSGAPILLTARYSWWQCGSAVTDRNSPGCTLQGVEPRLQVQNARSMRQ